MHCIWHPYGNHTTGQCKIYIDRGYSRKKRSEEKKNEDQNKQPEDQEDGGFPKTKGIVAVIISGEPGSRSKCQDKLALRSIMAAEPTTLRYLNWSQYLIKFSREDQWTSISNVGHYPLVLDPIMARITIRKVLIDGGAGLNIIF